MPPAERQYDSIIDLFLERVAHEPHAPILVHEDLTWDASALSDRVHRLAHLLAEQGLGPGRTVGLCLERSPELIVSVLAVLRVGAAYVPVDPSYPSDRIAAMLEDARPPVVITDSTCSSPAAAPADPKGVAMHHAPLTEPDPVATADLGAEGRAIGRFSSRPSASTSASRRSSPRSPKAAHWC
jgi:non-ribosomal peptide synthetase component F